MIAYTKEKSGSTIRPRFMLPIALRLNRFDHSDVVNDGLGKSIQMQELAVTDAILVAGDVDQDASTFRYTNAVL